MLLPAQGMLWARRFLPVSQQCGFQHFQGHCANSPPISRVAFCILSTSGESDVKYSACLPLLHCELSGIKAAQNAVKCILEQHGQESLILLNIKIDFTSLCPVGFNTGKSSCFPPANWILLFVPSVLEPTWFCYDHTQGDQQGYFVTSQILEMTVTPLSASIPSHNYYLAPVPLFAISCVSLCSLPLQ